MRLYAFERAKSGDDSEKSIAERININPSTISVWKTEQGFLEWLESEVAVYRAPILHILEQVAVTNLEDFRFWEAMAKKYGFISKDQESPGTGARSPGAPVDRETLLELVKAARGNDAGNASGT